MDPYDELKKKLKKKKKQKKKSSDDHPVHEDYAEMGDVKQ